MALPTVLPSEATSLDLGKKRKVSEIVDLTGDDSPPCRSKREPPRVSDDPKPIQEEEVVAEDEAEEDDDDGSSIWEDFQDQLEEAPWQNDGEQGISDEQVAELRNFLREKGIEDFFQEVFDKRDLTPQQVGIVFGMDPSLDVDEDTFLRLLGVAVMRAYYKRRKLVQYNTIDDAVELLKKSQKIMVITGAGISTSLGIPDFRSKESGFYEKLRREGYDDPEDVFNIRTFDAEPEKFYKLAADILPDGTKFSPTHAFIRLLQDKDRLQTNYTQNIDNLEASAGIDPNRLIQCHGSFATATCRICRHKVLGTEIFNDIRAKRIPACKKCIITLQTAQQAPRPQKRPRPDRYSSADSDSDDDIPQPGVMKPDITFFGEQLPEKFFERFTNRDAKQTDLVIVIGTSLKVAPVSEMPNFLPHPVPHIYISREPIQHINFDIQLLGNCDDVVTELCQRAGWGLKHEMIPKGFAANVSPVDGAGHCWVIAPKEREVRDSDDESEANDEDVTFVPEGGFRGNVPPNFG